MTQTILLASQSPRRRQLLAITGWPFVTQPMNVDETSLVDELPQDYVMRIAESKARAAASLAQPEQVILAADTTVADGRRIFGKPVDAQDARDMLRALRGHDHWVYTAIAAFHPGTQQFAQDLISVQVWLRDYSDAEIEAYIASGDPLDKAGAYAIQHNGFHPVERIDGCYAGVVGLPICRVVNLLAQFGFTPRSDVISGCQAGLGDACSVFPEGFASLSRIA